MSMRVPSGFFGEQGEHEIWSHRKGEYKIRPYTGADVFQQPLQDSFSVIPAGWFGNLFKKPDPPMALAGLVNVLIGTEVADTSDALSFLCSRAMLIPEESLQNDVDIFYERARQNDSVCSWEVVTPNYRKPYAYCRDECAFLCEEIGKGIVSKFPDVRVFSVRMTRSSMGVYASVGDSNRQVSYDYHVALALVDKEGRIGMIDPVVYERASVVSFEDWWGRFDHTKGDYGFRVRQFVNETT